MRRGVTGAIGIIVAAPLVYYCISIATSNELPTPPTPPTPQVAPPGIVERKFPPPRVVQPIDFPHWRHAGPASEDGLEINCLYCHSYARRSAVAGIPTLAKCMGCHKHIATDKERIIALTEYWNQRKPVPWKKVHDLPDFVYFTHERHIQRFVFQLGQPVQRVCGYCHGDVKVMAVAERKKPLQMGWCLSCHKQFQEGPVAASASAWAIAPNPKAKPGLATPQPANEWLIKPTDKSLLFTGADKDLAHLGKAPSDCWMCHK